MRVLASPAALGEDERRDDEQTAEDAEDDRDSRAAGRDRGTIARDDSGYDCDAERD